MISGGIKNLLTATLLSAFVFGASGFYGGWVAKDNSYKAKETKVLNAARADDVVTAQKAVAESVVIEKAVDASEARIESIKAKVRKHEQTVATCPNVEKEVRWQETQAGALQLEAYRTDPILEPAVVRLLNAAREGRSADPAPGGDAEVEASAPVAVSDLIQNDLSVVGEYHSLAKRHDALVDWVTDLVAKHNTKITQGQ